MKSDTISTTSLRNTPVDKVPKVIQQFTIVLQHQVFPAEWTVLMTNSQQ